jgi:hypothetical protein
MVIDHDRVPPDERRPPPGIDPNDPQPERDLPRREPPERDLPDLPPPERDPDNPEHDPRKEPQKDPEPPN